MNPKFIGLVAIMASAIALSSCNKEKLEQLQAQNQSLASEKARQDSVLNEMLSAFNQFEDNLSLIKERENLVSAAAADGSELEGDSKEQVLADIQMINELLADNRSIISKLTSDLEAAEGESSQLRRAVSRLKRQLEERDAEVASLKTQLESLNIAIGDLNSRIDTLSEVNSTLASLREQQAARIQQQEATMSNQSQTIAAQTEALNTAYYLAAESRELKRTGVTDGNRLATNFNSQSFTRIDITQVSSIPIGTKKAKVLTPHPTDSYTLVEEGGEVASLKITDARRFWQASKYLVIEVN